MFWLQAQENLGMAMIFTLAAAAKEWLDDQQSAAEHVEAKALEAQQAQQAAQAAAVRACPAPRHCSPA